MDSRAATKTCQHRHDIVVPACGRPVQGHTIVVSSGKHGVHCGAQVQIRRLPKPVIAMVAGYAVGGGHILHMMCDLTIAADNAVFGQTGPKVGSFDAGYGSTQMARLIGGAPSLPPRGHTLPVC